MTKYRVTYEVEVYAETPRAGYHQAMRALNDVMLKHNTIRVGDAMDLAGLPNGGIDGKPHTPGTLDGALVKYDMAEAS